MGLNLNYTGPHFDIRVNDNGTMSIAEGPEYYWTGAEIGPASVENIDALIHGLQKIRKALVAQTEHP